MAVALLLVARIVWMTRNKRTQHHRAEAGLQHQAQMRHSDAATARDEVNQKFARANTNDPDAPYDDTSNGDTATGEPARDRSTTDRQNPKVMPRAK